MMATPQRFIEPKTINPRLVTKTSLKDTKQAIAALYLLWEASGHPGVKDYGVLKHSGLGIELGADDLSLLMTYCRRVLGEEAPSSEDVEKWFSSNPLYTIQLEPLNAAFELIWHLARIDFIDPSKNASSEREGGKRFPKRARFSTNMDILRSLHDADQKAFLQVMLNWVSSSAFAAPVVREPQIIMMLTAFAEVSFYKMGKGAESEVYTTCGIYNALLDDGDGVEFVTPGGDAVGPTRILKAAASSGLNTYLQSENGKTATIAQGIDATDLRSYAERSRTTMELSRIKIQVEGAAEDKAQEENMDISQEFVPAEEVDAPRNMIYFGAPGTGKSYNLGVKASECFEEQRIRRVTFHPDYSYAQFVGCYKPKTDVADGKHEVYYGFTPGPFTQTYIEACKHPDKNYLLLIEEINRANPAAVFGDVFQLLDRGSDGVSEYPVAADEDLGMHLYAAFTFWRHDETRIDLLTEDEVACERVSSLALPANMYIWATMNSADQGVFPMDTAFKRRWEFKYLGIDEKEAPIEGKTVLVGGKVIDWNMLRKDINALLVANGVNEDKLIGPFFVKPSVLDDPELFADAFCSKVLLYLYEDAARMSRRKIFGNLTYSQVRDKFIAEGLCVFNGYKEFKSLAKADAAAESES